MMEKNEGERGRIREDRKNRKMTKRMSEFDSFYRYSEFEFMSYFVHSILSNITIYDLEGNRMRWSAMERERRDFSIRIDAATIK